MSTKMQEDLAAAEVLVAKHFGVAHCTNPECACGNVYIQLFDGRKELFAVAPLSAGAASEIAGCLIEAADVVVRRSIALSTNGATMLPSPAQDASGRVTSDPDYPADGAALFSAFNSCAEGLPHAIVLDAAFNFLVCAIFADAKKGGLGRDAIIERARSLGESFPQWVAKQLDRVPQPTDVAVKPN